MGWISPRKAQDVARRVAESAAQDLEKQLGRSLSGKELKNVHEEVEKGVSAAAKQARRNAR